MFNFSLPFASSIQKRLFKFIFKRLCGRFVHELDLSQLDVQILAGLIELKNVSLNVEVLNEFLSGLAFPVRLSGGYVQSIKAQVPWKSILKDSFGISVSGIELTFVIGERADRPHRSMAASSLYASMQLQQSMANSMMLGGTTGGLQDAPLMSSMLLGELRPNQMAQEIGLEADEPLFEATSVETEPPAVGTRDQLAMSFEGMQIIAGEVERLVSKITANLEDATFRFECKHPTRDVRTVLLLHIPKLEFFDETPTNPGERAPQSSSSSVFFIKSIRFLKLLVQLYEIPTDSDNSGTSPSSDPAAASGGLNFGDTVLSADVHVENQITVKLLMGKDEAFTAVSPSLDIDIFLRSIHAALTPDQIRLLSDLTLCLRHAMASSTTAASASSVEHQNQAQPKKFSSPNLKPKTSCDDDDETSLGKKKAAKKLGEKEFKEVEKLLEEHAGESKPPPSAEQQADSSPVFLDFDPLASVRMTSAQGAAATSADAGVEFLFGGNDVDSLHSSQSTDGFFDDSGGEEREGDASQSSGQDLRCVIHLVNSSVSLLYEDTPDMSVVWENYLRPPPSESGSIDPSAWGASGPPVSVDHMLLDLAELVVSAQTGSKKNEVHFAIGTVKAAERLRKKKKKKSGGMAQSMMASTYHEDTIEFVERPILRFHPPAAASGPTTASGGSHRTTSATSRTPQIACLTEMFALRAGRQTINRSDISLRMHPLDIDVDLGLISRLTKVFSVQPTTPNSQPPAGAAAERANAEGDGPRSPGKHVSFGAGPTATSVEGAGGKGKEEQNGAGLNQMDPGQSIFRDMDRQLSKGQQTTTIEETTLDLLLPFVKLNLLYPAKPTTPKPRAGMRPEHLCIELERLSLRSKKRTGDLEDTWTCEADRIRAFISTSASMQKCILECETVSGHRPSLEFTSRMPTRSGDGSGSAANGGGMGDSMLSSVMSDVFIPFSTDVSSEPAMYLNIESATPDISTNYFEAAPPGGRRHAMEGAHYNARPQAQQQNQRPSPVQQSPHAKNKKSASGGGGGEDMFSMDEELDEEEVTMQAARTAIRIRLPSLTAELNKPDFFLFIELVSDFVDLVSPPPTEPGLSGGPSTPTTSGPEEPSTTVVSVHFAKCRATLHVPAAPLPPPTGEAEEEEGEGQPPPPHHYQIALDDLRIFQISHDKGDVRSQLRVHGDALCMQEVLSEGVTVPILRKSDKIVKPFHANRKGLRVFLTKKRNERLNMTESVTQVHLHGALMDHRMARDGDYWLFVLLDFFDDNDTTAPETTSNQSTQTPPPLTFSRMFITFTDCVIDYSPLNAFSRAAIILGTFKLSTQSMGGAKESRLVLGCDDSSIMVHCHFKTDLLAAVGGVDDKPSVFGFPVKLAELGFATVANMDGLELAIIIRKKHPELTEPPLSVECTKGSLSLSTCSDSFQVFFDTVMYWVDGRDLNPNGTSAANSPPPDETPELIMGPGLDGRDISGALSHALSCVYQDITESIVSTHLLNQGGSEEKKPGKKAGKKESNVKKWAGSGIGLTAFALEDHFAAPGASGGGNSVERKAQVPEYLENSSSSSEDEENEESSSGGRVSSTDEIDLENSEIFGVGGGDSKQRQESTRVNEEGVWASTAFANPLLPSEVQQLIGELPGVSVNTESDVRKLLEQNPELAQQANQGWVVFDISPHETTTGDEISGKFENQKGSMLFPKVGGNELHGTQYMSTHSDESSAYFSAYGNFGGVAATQYMSTMHSTAVLQSQSPLRSPSNGNSPAGTPPRRPSVVATLPPPVFNFSTPPGNGATSGPIVNLTLDDHYFPLPKNGEDEEVSIARTQGSPVPQFEVQFSNVTITWHVFGSQDWPSASETDPQQRFSVHESDFESPKFGPSTRDSDRQVDFVAEDFRFRFSVFPDPVPTVSSSPKSPAAGGVGEVGETKYAWSMALAVQDIEILDKLKVSKRHKMLCYLRSPQTPRESKSSMLHMTWESIGNDPHDPTNQEARIQINVLPLRINADQDTVEFLAQFFSAPPVHSVPPVPNLQPKPIHLQHFELSDVSMSVDYNPKHVNVDDVKRNGYLELAKAVPISGLALRLKGTTVNGVDGWNRLIDRLVQVWVPDIRRSQLHKCITGIMPIRSLVNLTSGVTDLVTIPLQTYRKDKKIVRGISRGVSSFVKNVAVETLGIVSGMSGGTQALLESATGMLGAEVLPQPISVVSGGGGGSSGSSGGATITGRQPRDASEGLQQAYGSLRKGMNNAVHSLVAIPLAEYQEKGTPAFLKSAIRGVPIAVLSPVIGATEALSKALIGARNSMDPMKKQDHEDMYKF